MTSTSVKTLGLFRQVTKFDKGLGARLPEAYKKFYKEWLLTEPTGVHYIPEEGKWKRNELTGEVLPIQNIPIPLKFPLEAQNQIWGGDSVIQGFEKRGKYKRRVPHFWVPHLKRSVVYSEVLDKYMSVIVTERALQLIHSSYGFDHYILKTLACDLKSLLPLRLKRKILKELEQGCPTYADRPEKQKEIQERYKQYLAPFTSEDIEWYGYTFNEAIRKLESQLEAEKKIIPLKQVFRSQLIEQLKTAKIEAAKEGPVDISGTTSWIQKMNPFGKKHET